MIKAVFKKITAAVVCILLLCCVFLPQSSISAATVDGLIIENGIVKGASAGVTEIAIPERAGGKAVRSIAAEAFKDNKEIVSVSMPDSITAIGNSAFEGCTSLVNLNLSQKLSSLGARAFYGCKALRKVEIPSSLKRIGPKGNNGYAFAECASLKEVIINEGVENTATHTFYKCVSLTKLTLPQSLTEIGIWAFGNCETLAEVKFPENLKSVGPAAFYACYSLKEIILPDSLDDLGTHAFRACESAETLHISENLKIIPFRAFSGTSKLEEITIPNSVESIGDEAFYASGIEKITLSENLREIGKSAFFKCRFLTEITLPQSVTTLGEGAFYECIALESADLSSGVSRLESNTFYNCVKLNSLILPDSLETISANAFVNCNQLISLTLPSPLSSIEDNAFNNTKRIFEIFNHSSLELEAGSTAHGGVALAAACIHDGAADSCLVNDKNGYLFHISENGKFLAGYEGEHSVLHFPESLDGKVYNILPFAFFSNSQIKSAIIPDCVSVIGRSAFDSCKNLYKVDIPTSVTQVEEDAFANSNNITNIFYEGNKAAWQEITFDSGNEIVTDRMIIFKGEEIDISAATAEHKSFFESAVDFLAEHMFFINFLLILFWGIIFVYTGRRNDSEAKQKTRKLMFVIIVCLQWILVSGLRGDIVGADTVTYMDQFDKHINLSWREIFAGFKPYILGEENELAFEPGFMLFEKLIGCISASHVFYKFLVAVIFTSALGFFVYRNSKDPCMAFVLYSALFYNMFALTGYRQVISVAIAFLMGYEFIKKRKLVPFIILLIISFFFHKSSLVFILVYFLADKKITRPYILSAMGAIAVMIVFRNQLFQYVKVIVGYEQYSGDYGFAQGTFTVLLIALTLVAIYQYPVIKNDFSNYTHMYNGLILMWAMMPFAMVSPTSMRLVYDFGFTLVMTLPAIIKSFKGRYDRIIAYGVIFLMFGYFIFTRSPVYQFFWQ